MPSFFSATDSRLEWSGAAINDPFPLLSCNAQAVAHDHGPRLRPMGSDGRPGSFDGSGLAALEPRSRQSWPWGPRSSGCRRVRAGGASAARKITVEPLRIARLWRACCRSGCDAHRLECDDATWPVALIRGGACPCLFCCRDGRRTAGPAKARAFEARHAPVEIADVVRQPERPETTAAITAEPQRAE